MSRPANARVTNRPPQIVMSGSKIKNGGGERSRRLRRLTQAYLTPLSTLKPGHNENSLNRADHIYNLTQKLILRYQSATTGLFPRYSTDKDAGYVKDSIFCAWACWASSIAYKRLDDDRGRHTELKQTAVKTMRGILFCWMQQIEKLNKFKDNNSPDYALHCRFDLQTGLEIETSFQHLQMDVVALYILALVEMTAGGIQIIYTQHEVSFLQNLVFYIERTYRTPDFGLWERGSRYNTGVPELHASSLGLVKAALEAVNGFNAYGPLGTSASVIYVDIDGHNRNRTTFETILPRESNSKNTDAGLLIAIGWPAFATHDQALFDKTLNKIFRHLEGRFGIRRYLRDGYKTEIEDTTRRHSTEEETYTFRNIESQFPMFFAFITISAIYKGNTTLADRYWQKFESLMVPGDYSGLMTCPECYCIDEECMDRERASPNSQEFYAVNPIEFGHHLFSNAVYLVALLMRDRLIHPSDLDPIYRHLPASQRPKFVNRHSAFQGSMEGDPVVQIALIAESARLQGRLATYGISTQTPHEIEPVQIWPSWRMVKVFEALGKDDRLNLSGRPPRPFGPLNTSKILRVCGMTVLCYPLLFEMTDFYTNADPATLIEDVKRDIEFVAKRWKLAGRPTFCMVLRDENVVPEYFEHLLDLLVAFKTGYINGIRVRIGRIHQLLNTGCIEHVDFVNIDDVEFDRTIFEEIDATAAHLKSKSSMRPIPTEQDLITEAELSIYDDHALFQIITEHNIDHLRNLAFAISVMINRYTRYFTVAGETLESRLERVYRQACQWRLWWTVRYCAAKLQKTITSLAPGITNLLVRGKRVVIGSKNSQEITISAPLTPTEIARAIFRSADPLDPHATVFQQELIIACADIVLQKPDAFNGILAIRLVWLKEAMQLLLDYFRESSQDGFDRKRKIVDVTSLIESSCPNAVAKQLRVLPDASVYDLPPTVVRDLLRALLIKKNWHLLTPLQIRRLNGALNRVPINLYDRVWRVLERASDGIIIANQKLAKIPTFKVMTPHELTFSYKIEAMMGEIAHPEYRQLVVELLCIIATIAERNPELPFYEAIDCDGLIKQAFGTFCDEKGIEDREDFTPFYLSDDGATTRTYLIKALMDRLLKDNLPRKFSFLGDNAAADLITDNRSDDTCHVQ
uniref:Phosphorylase b kinase regulatory subunit n=1 Tax=Panagrellus redivivus TaxID=6233 RepID=A0A7E4ZX26_PANRE